MQVICSPLDGGCGRSGVPLKKKVISQRIVTKDDQPLPTSRVVHEVSINSSFGAFLSGIIQSILIFTPIICICSPLSRSISALEFHISDGSLDRSQNFQLPIRAAAIHTPHRTPVSNQHPFQVPQITRSTTFSAIVVENDRLQRVDCSYRCWVRKAATRTI